MLKSALIVACLLGVVLSAQGTFSPARYGAGTVAALPVMTLGWRSGQMYIGLRQIDYRLIGWGWMPGRAAPRKDQHQTVDATAQLIPVLRARGFDFGTVCQNGA